MITYSFSHFLEKIFLPIIVVKVGEIHLTLFVDSAADTSMLSNFVYKQYPDLFKRIPIKSSGRGWDGKLVDTPVVETQLEFGNEKVNTYFRVWPSDKAMLSMQQETQIHGCLGMDFLVSHRCTLDFEHMEFSIMDSVDDFLDNNEDAFEEAERMLQADPWACYRQQLDIIEAHADEIEKALAEHQKVQDEQIAFLEAHADEIEKAIQDAEAAREAKIDDIMAHADEIEQALREYGESQDDDDSQEDKSDAKADKKD